jgi:hypothetical protein
MDKTEQSKKAAELIKTVSGSGLVNNDQRTFAAKVLKDLFTILDIKCEDWELKVGQVVGIPAEDKLARLVTKGECVRISEAGEISRGYDFDSLQEAKDRGRLILLGDSLTDFISKSGWKVDAAKIVTQTLK